MQYELQIIAGDIAAGRGSYQSGTFLLPKKITLGIEHVIAVHQQGVVTEGSVVGAVKDGVAAAVSLGPVGLVLGAAFAPAAIPVGISAAVLGAGLGLLGGGKKNKAAIHVTLRDGRHFTAVCEEALVPVIANDVNVTRAIAERYRPPPEAPVPKPRALWNRGDVLKRSDERPAEPPAAPAPLALPAPEPVDSPSGVLDALAGVATATGDAAASLASAAGSTASAAYDAAGNALGSMKSWLGRKG